MCFKPQYPPADVVIVDACLDLIDHDPSLIKSLWHKTNYFRDKLVNLGFEVGNSSSPIVPIYIRDPQILMSMEKELFEREVFAIAAIYPVVKATEGRFRFIVNNSHKIEDIDHLTDTLYELGLKYNLISEAKN